MDLCADYEYRESIQSEFAEYASINVQQKYSMFIGTTPDASTASDGAGPLLLENRPQTQLWRPSPSPI